MHAVTTIFRDMEAYGMEAQKAMMNTNEEGADVAPQGTAETPIHGDTRYISTYLGNRFYPLERRIDAIHIEDIAHGLAFQCRFNGQTRDFYSVAQHSLLVADLVPPAQRRAALLHDASEAYVGDVVKPLKVLLPEYAAIEEEVTALIAEHFQIDFRDYHQIKRADLIALATEKRDLMPNSTESWSYLAGFEPLPARIQPMPPREAKAAFLQAWHATHCAQPVARPPTQTPDRRR